MQWPPTPSPGWWMWLYGWLLAAAMTSSDVDPDPVGVPGELVGQGDVDVAVGRVGELRELGRLGRRHRDDVGVEDAVVERRRPGGRGLAEPADELRVGGQVAEGRAAVQPLRREGDEQVLLEGQPGRLGQASARSGPRVSPTGSVVSKMTVEPACSPGAIASTAASIER